MLLMHSFLFGTLTCCSDWSFEEFDKMVHQVTYGSELFSGFFFLGSGTVKLYWRNNDTNDEQQHYFLLLGTRSWVVTKMGTLFFVGFSRGFICWSCNVFCDWRFSCRKKTTEPRIWHRAIFLSFCKLSPPLLF